MYYNKQLHLANVKYILLGIKNGIIKNKNSTNYKPIKYYKYILFALILIFVINKDTQKLSYKLPKIVFLCVCIVSLLPHEWTRR